MSRPRNNLSSLLVLLAIVTGGANAKQPSRIIGGELAPNVAYTVALAVFRPEKSVTLCGGGIIGPRHVLTAAHCVHNVDSDNVNVHAGIRDLRDTVNGVVRLVGRVVVHPQYVPWITGRQNMQNDIAILVLKEALPIGGRIASLSLPTRQPQGGVTYTVAGWGRNSLDTNDQMELKMLDMKIGNAYACRAFVRHSFCAYAQSGSPCLGDSGSPLVGGDHIYGIVSTVSCEVGGLAGYVNVYDYLDWINFSIRQNP